MRIQKCKCNHAFTLVELLVTVAIVGILASLAIANFDEYRQRSYNTAAIAQAKSAASALEAAYSDGTFLCDFTIYQNGTSAFGAGSSSIATCLPGFTHQSNVMVAVRSYAASSFDSSNVIACHNQGSLASDGSPLMYSVSSKRGGLEVVDGSFSDVVWPDIAGFRSYCPN